MGRVAVVVSPVRGRGTQVLCEWFGRAGIRLEPLRLYRRGHVVVVEQEAEWRSTETGGVAGWQAPASVFRVEQGRVASVIRYPDLAAALAVAGLDEADGA